MWSFLYFNFYSAIWHIIWKYFTPFVKSLLTFKTCFDTFFLQNLMIVVPLLTNSVTIFNVFVRHFNTSLRYCFPNNVLEIIVTDWWWDARDLEAISPGILGICPALFFYSLESYLATKLLFIESILLCKLTTSATKSGFLSLFCDTSISAAIASSVDS